MFYVVILNKRLGIWQLSQTYSNRTEAEAMARMIRDCGEAAIVETLPVA